MAAFETASPGSKWGPFAEQVMDLKPMGNGYFFNQGKVGLGNVLETRPKARSRCVLVQLLGDASSSC